MNKKLILNEFKIHTEQINKKFTQLLHKIKTTNYHNFDTNKLKLREANKKSVIK